MITVPNSGSPDSPCSWKLGRVVQVGVASRTGSGVCPDQEVSATRGEETGGGGIVNAPSPLIERDAGNAAGKRQCLII